MRADIDLLRPWFIIFFSFYGFQWFLVSSITSEWFSMAFRWIWVALLCFHRVLTVFTVTLVVFLVFVDFRVLQCFIVAFHDFWVFYHGLTRDKISFGKMFAWLNVLLTKCSTDKMKTRGSHKRTFHGGEGSFSCEICGKVKSTARLLKCHMISHRVAVHA